MKRPYYCWTGESGRRSLYKGFFEQLIFVFKFAWEALILKDDYIILKCNPTFDLDDYSDHSICVHVKFTKKER